MIALPEKLSIMSEDDRAASDSIKRLLEDLSNSVFCDVGPTEDYDITTDAKKQRCYSYLDVAPDNFKLLIKNVNKMMYDDFQEYMLYYIERQLQNRLRAVSDLEQTTHDYAGVDILPGQPMGRSRSLCYGYG